MITLYSNHCPKCDILKGKLDTKNVTYTLVDDTTWLSANGFDQMPILEVDGKRMPFMEANTYVNTL